MQTSPPPPYGSPVEVQLFHDQVTELPAVIVLEDGLNELFWTEIPPAGGGVLPLGGGGFVEPPPPPPHALAEISANAIHAFLVLICLSI
jgi:hypothetical protein